MPSAGYTFSQSWNIVNNGSPISTTEVNFGDEVSKFFFKAFPNPTTDILNIDYFHSGVSMDANVSIASVDGRVSESKAIELFNGEGKFELNIEKFPAGIYIININGKQLSTSFQIVKQ